MLSIGVSLARHDAVLPNGNRGNAGEMFGEQFRDFFHLD
jgi:hypothetical protein